VARTTLYRNFGNSAELLAAAFERLLPPVELEPETGSLRERLTGLLIRKSALIEQVPVQRALLTWLGMSLRTPGETPAAGTTAVGTTAPEAGSPAMLSLRTRVIEHYRQPFDRILGSEQARAVLGEPDPDFVAAQLLGPIFFLWLTGLRPVTPADCERIVDDFLAARGRQ
jgi:AcrR family transcriptional regulator